MKKLLILFTLFATSVYAMEQPSEAKLLEQYVRDIGPGTRGINLLSTARLSSVKTGRGDSPVVWVSLPTIDRRTGLILERALRERKAVADNYLKVLKAAYPRRYRNINDLDVDWRRHQAIAERKNELLRLLKIHRLAAATPFRRLNVDIEGILLPSLAGKTDMELEEIAEFYAIPFGTCQKLD